MVAPNQGREERTSSVHGQEQTAMSFAWVVVLVAVGLAAAPFAYDAPGEARSAPP